MVLIRCLRPKLGLRIGPSTYHSKNLVVLNDLNSCKIQSLPHLLLVVDHPELGEVLREGGGDAGRGAFRGGARAATVVY